MTLSMLPLDSLILSKLNVRHTERDADIAALGEDIAAHGLKQNLVVVPAHYSTGEATEGWADKWEVVAGGRRYQAMQLLVADGRLPADHLVPCLLEDRANASETSLSENLHKVAMNPADEFSAFSTIVAARENDHCDTRDAAIAHCAKRFGKPVRYVEGRLRLATLAPEILDALRADKIGLEAAKAYARVANHDLQRHVFAMHEKDTWRGHRPQHIRSDLGGMTLPLDAPLANFVGLVTYQAEGGRIENEMFMGTAGEQRLTDVRLLEKLARQIAEAAIPALVKADGFKSGLLANGIGRNALYPKAPAGFERAWDYCATISKAKLKKSIAVYAVNNEGTGLERIGRFKSADEIKAASKAPVRDWKADRRTADIKCIAAKMSARQLAAIELLDTPERPLTWPDQGYIREVESVQDESGDVLVAIQIRVTKAECDAHLVAAEAQYEARQDTPEPASTETAEA